MPDLIFHIGLTKTASSYLQQKILGGKLHTLSRAIDQTKDKAEALEFQKFFTKHDASVWERPQGKDWFSRYDDENPENVIISHESLYQHIPFVASEQSLRDEPECFVRKIKAIKEQVWHDGAVKVLFFYRKQDSWLPSIYSHVSYILKKPSQKDFNARVLDFISDEAQTSHVLEYDLLISRLQSSLGENNVLAIPYESFGEESTGQRIETFLGVKDVWGKFELTDRSVNTKRRPEEDSWLPSDSIYKYANSSTFKMFRPLAKKFLGRDLRYKLASFLGYGWRLHISEPLSEKIMARFEASNRRTGDLCDIDLSRYGYYDN